MEKTDDQKIDPSDGIQTAKCSAACWKDVRDQDDDRRDKLQKCSRDTLDIFDELIQEDDSRIKYRGTQAEHDTEQIISAVNITDADDENKPKCWHDKTYDLFYRQSFAK